MAQAVCLAARSPQVLRVSEFCHGHPKREREREKKNSSARRLTPRSGSPAPHLRRQPAQANRPRQAWPVVTEAGGKKERGLKKEVPGVSKYLGKWVQDGTSTGFYGVMSHFLRYFGGSRYSKYPHPPRQVLPGDKSGAQVHHLWSGLQTAEPWRLLVHVNTARVFARTPAAGTSTTSTSILSGSGAKPPSFFPTPGAPRKVGLQRKRPPGLSGVRRRERERPVQLQEAGPC